MFIMWRRSTRALSWRNPRGIASEGWLTRAIGSILIHAAGRVDAFGGDVIGRVEREPDDAGGDLLRREAAADRDALSALVEKGVEIIGAVFELRKLALGSALHQCVHHAGRDGIDE